MDFFMISVLSLFNNFLSLFTLTISILNDHGLIKIIIRFRLILKIQLAWINFDLDGGLRVFVGLIVDVLVAIGFLVFTSHFNFFIRSILVIKVYVLYACWLLLLLDLILLYQQRFLPSVR